MLKQVACNLGYLAGRIASHIDRFVAPIDVIRRLDKASGCGDVVRAISTCWGLARDIGVVEEGTNLT